MITIDKSNLEFKNFMDTEEVERAVKVSGTSLNEDFILSYDTKEAVVYHSTKEINKAMTRLSSGYIKEFNRLYAINQDIHDCIDGGLIDNITQAVMIEVCPASMHLKYFLSLQDYVEEVMVSNYNELQTA